MNQNLMQLRGEYVTIKEEYKTLCLKIQILSNAAWRGLAAYGNLHVETPEPISEEGALSAMALLPEMIEKIRLANHLRLRLAELKPLVNLSQ